ncbi:hypothetical protein MVEN_00299700 [Mycena venus]|uniref:DUF6534 domain-containing protein n=1 Tax=Mycena venus TaxID=2733690 RepID=A0A8H7DCT8_9AGAR|nr:hypothetical protein MVEN_00299700 [Mycena venus]
MFEIIQGLHYFRHFEKDDWTLKTLVTVALLVDTVSTVGDCICVYLYTITYVGDLEYLSNGHWPIPLYTFTTGVLGVLVQGFLVIRYWRFTRNSFISLFLSLGIIVALCSVFASGFVVALYPSFKDRVKAKIPAALWLITEVVVDTGIASALLWEFRKASGILTETKGILDRLTVVTVQSGAAAATLAGGGLISYCIDPESNLAGAFLFPLGRVYVITLLANLNIRKSGSTTIISSGAGSASGGEQRPLTLTSLTCWSINDSCGIHVTVYPSAQVSVEDSQSPGTVKNPV